MATYTIRVINMETGAHFEHKYVPMDHVENLRLNANLLVEVVEVSMRRTRKKKSDES